MTQAGAAPHAAPRSRPSSSRSTPDHLRGDRRAARDRDPARPARAGHAAPPGARARRRSCGISRSTLRQALTTLVQSGHLVSRRGRSGGTFVAEEPPLGAGASRRAAPAEHARAVLDYRVAVETGATVLAAERATEDDLDRLGRLTERWAARGGRASRSTGAPTCASTSGWPRPATRRAWSRR